MIAFLQLPESTITCVLHEWLTLKECVAMETAFGHKQSRERFLSCLQLLPIKPKAKSKCYTADGYVTVPLLKHLGTTREFDIVAMLTWIVDRGVQIKDLKVELTYNQVDSLLEKYRASPSNLTIFDQVKELRFAMERRKFTPIEDDSFKLKLEGVDSLCIYTNSDIAPLDLFACFFTFFPNLEELTLPAHLNEKVAESLMSSLAIAPKLQRIRAALNLPTPLYTNVLVTIGDKIAFLYEFLADQLENYLNLCKNMKRYVIMPKQIPMLSSALVQAAELELVIPADQADSVTPETISLLEEKLVEMSSLEIFRCRSWPLASFGRILGQHPSIQSVSDDSTFQCVRDAKKLDNSFCLKVVHMSSVDNYQPIRDLIEGAPAIGRLILEDNAALTSFVYRLPDMLRKHYQHLRRLDMTYYLVHNVRDCLEVLLGELPALESLVIFSLSPICIDWRRERWTPILNNLLEFGKKLKMLVFDYIPVIADDDVEAIVTQLTNLDTLDLTNDYHLTDKTIQTLTIPGKVWKKLSLSNTTIMHEHIVAALQAGLLVKTLECDKGNCVVRFGHGFVPLTVDHLLAEPLEVLQEK